jgi:hypothetical protein
MRVARVTTPQGDEWTVRAFRVRLPPWRQAEMGDDIWGDGGDIISLMIALVVLPFTMVLIPLALAVVELPVAVARGLLSRDRWIEAVAEGEGGGRYLWQTTRADAPGVHAAVAAQLSAGEAPHPARADLVSFS